jgi:hypothetical protein
MIEFARLSRIELLSMAAAGREVVDCEALLAAEGGVLAAALGQASAVYEWQHYPDGDFYDAQTHAQFFYHAHPPGERGNEHGHFHTFLRRRGMPAGVRPLMLPELAIAGNPAVPCGPSAPALPAGEEGEEWCHLVAIAMESDGRPLRFFTTNRWVTGETWYGGGDVAAMLDRFGFAAGTVPLARWVAGMIRLYRPQLAALLNQRDAAVMAWRRRRARVHVFEDRRLEVTSHLEIDLAAQRGAIEAALAAVQEPVR